MNKEIESSEEREKHHLKVKQKKTIEKSHHEEDLTSDILNKKIPLILQKWMDRSVLEIQAARGFEELALKNSIPEYLLQLVEDLSNNIDRTSARKIYDTKESTRLGQKHGKDRAINSEYSMDQLILEYQILRQVIFDVLDESVDLNPAEREVIICSIEQAVNDAATQYSKSIKELQEKLTHTLAHDLRTPLFIAQISSELIIKNPNEATLCLIKAENISKSIRRMDKMITELLDFSRLNSVAGIEIDRTECSLNDLIKEIEQELNIIYEKKLKIKYSTKDARGHWNKPGLRRMIENLITNAFKHGKKNTLVTLEISETKANTILTIHNEGDPITQEEQKLMFTNFKRGKSADKTQGWGLGLTVVKDMVDKHGGEISIKSEEDYGTDFIIKLPKNIAVNKKSEH